MLLVWLLSACSSYAVDDNWQWKIDLERSIESANHSVVNMEIGSYWNKEYRSAVFSISNAISKGWSSKDFDAEQYNAILTNIWNNSQELHILKDELIRIAALKWRLNLKNKCVKSEVDIDAARKYFIEMIGSNENIIKNSAISGLGMIGEKVDVDKLLALLIENQDNFIGSTALNSLFLAESGLAVDALKSRISEISNKSIKRKVKEELSYTRVTEDKCSN